MSKTLITSRDSKGLQAVSIFEAAYNKAELDEAAAQRLNERGDKLKKKMSKLIVELSADNHPILSGYGSHSAYTQVKPLVEQVNILRGLFPNLNGCDLRLGEKKLRDGAEGYFAIPRWQLFSKDYRKAVREGLDTIKKTRDANFENNSENLNCHLRRLRELPECRRYWEKLELEQGDYDILVVQAQFGARNPWYSYHTYLKDWSGINFAFNTFATSMMLLTHPERLKHHHDVKVVCEGDTYYDNSDSNVPCKYSTTFDYSMGTLWYNPNSVGDGMSRWKSKWGSVSGFLPT